jgi:hypothetical protein
MSFSRVTLAKPSMMGYLAAGRRAVASPYLLIHIPDALSSARSRRIRLEGTPVSGSPICSHSDVQVVQLLPQASRLCSLRRVSPAAMDGFITSFSPSSAAPLRPSPLPREQRPITASRFSECRELSLPTH